MSSFDNFYGGPQVQQISVSSAVASARSNNASRMSSRPGLQPRPDSQGKASNA